LQLTRRIEQICAAGEMAEILVLQADRSGSKPMAIEYIEGLGAELGSQGLPYRKRFRYREIFI
jgi:hypothetical protein